MGPDLVNLQLIKPVVLFLNNAISRYLLKQLSCLGCLGIFSGAVRYHILAPGILKCPSLACDLASLLR